MHRDVTGPLCPSSGMAGADRSNSGCVGSMSAACALAVWEFHTRRLWSAQPATSVRSSSAMQRMVPPCGALVDTGSPLRRSHSLTVLSSEPAGEGGVECCGGVREVQVMHQGRCVEHEKGVGDVTMTTMMIIVGGREESWPCDTCSRLGGTTHGHM